MIQPSTSTSATTTSTTPTLNLACTKQATMAATPSLRNHLNPSLLDPIMCFSWLSHDLVVSYIELVLTATLFTQLENLQIRLDILHNQGNGHTIRKNVQTEDLSHDDTELDK